MFSLAAATTYHNAVRIFILPSSFVLLCNVRWRGMVAGGGNDHVRPSTVYPSRLPYRFGKLLRERASGTYTNLHVRIDRRVLCPTRGPLRDIRERHVCRRRKDVVCSCYIREHPYTPQKCGIFNTATNSFHHEDVRRKTTLSVLYGYYFRQ